MNLQKLREKLKQGFYIDNLYDMAHLCRNLALDTASPTPFFVMERIFLDIARQWEDKPLLVEEAKSVESKMIGPLEELIEGSELAAPSQEILNLLDKVASAYLVSFI